MSAEPQSRPVPREHRWSRAELVGLVLAIWFLAILLFFVLVATP